MLDQSAGYWGPPTSTIDFCEPNYEMSHHVAEWWNMLSSIPLFLVGVSGVLLCRVQQLGSEQTLCYTVLAIVGLGTFAFHSTLTRTGQVMDEIPMLWAIAAFFYCGYQPRVDRRIRRGTGLLAPKPSQLARVGCGLGLYATVSMVAYFYVGFLPFIFMFASLVVVLGFLATTTFFSEELAVGPEPKRLLAVAAYTFAGGVVLLWLPGELLCHRFPILQRLPLHAFWHFASAAGSHLCLTAFALARYDGEGAVAAPSRAFAGLYAIDRRLDRAERGVEPVATPSTPDALIKQTEVWNRRFTIKEAYSINRVNVHHENARVGRLPSVVSGGFRWLLPVWQCGVPCGTARTKHRRKGAVEVRTVNTANTRLHRSVCQAVRVRGP